MPELPEVEILVRHLRPRVVGKRITGVQIMRSRSVWNASPRTFSRALAGRRITALTRQAKFLRFALDDGNRFLVHLGMTGRLRVVPPGEVTTISNHEVARILLGTTPLSFHDPRRFGRLELGDAALARCGPEPFGARFSIAYFAEALKKSRSPIKPRLLDQHLVAGLGNIYACEALWRARVHPQARCNRLDADPVHRLHKAIRSTLRDAIRFGGGLRLDFNATTSSDGLFYYGGGGRRSNPSEHFAVYDREGKPCRRCRARIVRIQQGGRSTYYCPGCQKE
jgi:formamidopyrimidine-DNA glycosylase